MYKPSGIPPYPTQIFHYGPPPGGPTPPPMPHAGVEGAHGHGPPWAAAPVYGLITDLPLPVPTADSQVNALPSRYLANTDIIPKCIS